MSPRRITHQNIFRVLMAGFGLVIAAAGSRPPLVGVRNIHSIQQNAASLVREQSVTNRLIDELHSQQTSLSEVFSVLARDPDSVDYDSIMSQLDEADRDIDRISAEGAQTAERDLWQRLQHDRPLDFSREARRILSIEEPETFASIDLFRYHEAFTSVVARLHRSRVPQGERGAGADRPPHLAPARHLPALRRRQRAAGAGLRRCHRAHGLAADSPAWNGRPPNWAASPGTCWKTRRPPRAASRTSCTTSWASRSPPSRPTWPRSHPRRAAESAARLADCLHLVDEAIGNVRQMSQLLRPTILDDFGLEAGLALAGGGLRRAHRDRGDGGLQLLRPPARRDRNAPVPHRAGGAHQRRAPRRGEARADETGTGNGGDIRLSIQDDGRGLQRRSRRPAAASA